MGEGERDPLTEPNPKSHAEAVYLRSRAQAQLGGLGVRRAFL